MVMKVSAREGASPSFTYDSRKLVEMYNVGQIARVVGLMRDHDARFFGPSHLIELMRVKNITQRETLEALAIIEHWSVKRLKKEIKRTKSSKQPK